MAKVIILGEQPVDKSSNPIVFIASLGSDDTFYQSMISPSKWENIELIRRKYNKSGHDLMYAYNSNRNNGVLYLGYFNDGFVE